MINAEPIAAAPISGLFANVYRQIVADEVRLPSLPDVALRIRAVMQNPNHTTKTVAQAIEADAGTSAYLVRVASSALYYGVATINSIEAAVQRLGIVTTRNLVTAYALRAMFQSRSPLLAGFMRDAWKRSARLAALASVIAKRCRGFSPDRALLAGLVQDIGMLPLVGALETRAGVDIERNRIAATLEEFVEKVGIILLTRWKFDEELVEVARSRGDWFRDSGDKPDLCDLITVARLHACVGDPDVPAAPRIDEVPAYRKLPLGPLTNNLQLGILLEADAEVRALTNMLGV